MRLGSTVTAAALIPSALLSGTTAFAPEPPSATATATSERTLSATTTPSTHRELCPNKNLEHGDLGLYSLVQALPEGVKAGDGWHEYLVTVPNKRSTTVKDVQVSLSKQAMDYAPGMPNDYSSYVDMQMTTWARRSAWPQGRGRESGEWRDVPFPSDNITTRTLITTNLAPLTSLQIQLRFRVAENFPANHPSILDGQRRPLGMVELGVRTYRPDPAEDGTCLRFDGSGAVVIDKPGPGTGDAAGSPTPTSPGLARLAGVGGAAFAVAGGAVYAARRRRRTRFPHHAGGQ